MWRKAWGVKKKNKKKENMVKQKKINWKNKINQKSRYLYEERLIWKVKKKNLKKNKSIAMEINERKEEKKEK